VFDEFIIFFRSKISSDLLHSINTEILKKEAGPENVSARCIKYLLSAPDALDIDQTRNELEAIIQQVLQKPSLSSDALQAILTFIFNHPNSSNDVIISALTAAHQLIILANADTQSRDIEHLSELLNQWTNPSVRTAGFAALIGLLKQRNFDCSNVDSIVKSFVEELKLYCSFVGDRDPNNQLKMAEALAFLSGYKDPSIARDFLSFALWFLQSEDSEIRDQAAETVASERFGHTECLLKLVDPSSIRGLCKDSSLIALSLCDRLSFSDDELLAVLGEVRGEINADLWRRENPYVEHWYVADVAYRQLDAFLDDNKFGPDQIREIVGALQLNEIRPFVEQCERNSICLGSTELQSAITSSKCLKTLPAHKGRILNFISVFQVPIPRVIASSSTGRKFKKSANGS